MGIDAITTASKAISGHSSETAENIANASELLDFIGTTEETFDTETSELSEALENGVLTAEQDIPNWYAAPKNRVASNGVQRVDFPVVASVSVNAVTIEKLKPLRQEVVKLRSPLFQRLALFVPQLQEDYGRKITTFTSVGLPKSFNGYYGLLDPRALAAHVPYCQTLDDMSEQQIQACFVGFHLIDMYPTIEGFPCWERMPWEQLLYYELFKLYRDMRYAFYDEGDAMVVRRSLSDLAKATCLSGLLLEYLAKVYHWQIRTSVYDTWMASQQQQRLITKRQLMANRHEGISQALTNKAFAVLQKSAEKMSAKDAISLLELGLKYERLSLGLPGDKPATESAQTAAPTLSIFNQTNNTTGPLQVNNQASSTEQQMQRDIKQPNTLLSILSVLQRSGALETAINAAEVQPSESSPHGTQEGDVIDVE